LIHKADISRRGAESGACFDLRISSNEMILRLAQEAKSPTAGQNGRDCRTRKDFQIMHEPRTHRSVLLDRRDAVAILTLNEPDSLNALSGGIKSGLEQNLPPLLADPSIRAIMLTGEGRAFCAGGDIRSMDEHQTVAVRERMKRSHRWLGPFLSADKPIITAVNGMAVGAGLSLALLGDIIVAARNARFKAGFPGLGAVPDLALAYTLPRAVGMTRAKDILLTNREIPADEALTMGLVTRVAEPEALMQEALKIASELARGPTVSFALGKQLLRRGYELSLDGFLELEALAQVNAFGSDDFAEGVDAFRKKRKPDFQGR
jgi:2-(1,2-epoxy-1,2-dihydrophenyl)acetyl-CoA isomerase